MSNDHLLRLKHQITPSSALVVLGNNYRWVSQAARQERQLEFQQLFKQFQNGWTNNNRTALMSLYANEQLLEQRFISTGGLQRRVSKTNTNSVSRAKGNNKAKNASQGFIRELAHIDAAHINITLNPLQPGVQAADTKPYLVMQARFGIINEHQVTLYWGQQNNGEWRIEAEKWLELDI